MADIPHVPLIIIGAGLSGLGTAIQLSRLQSFTAYELYEKADSLGGTWYPNEPRKLTVGGIILTVLFTLMEADDSWLWC